mmetsp:Transcript_34216/g.55050  ORF Transcript_34216/g.55050 Transcript_34216/m.55050 type:complete len:209 (-) Transcript_34216:132-758(-)
MWLRHGRPLVFREPKSNLSRSICPRTKLVEHDTASTSHVERSYSCAELWDVDKTVTLVNLLTIEASPLVPHHECCGPRKRRRVQRRSLRQNLHPANLEIACWVPCLQGCHRCTHTRCVLNRHSPLATLFAKGFEPLPTNKHNEAHAESCGRPEDCAEVVPLVQVEEDKVAVVAACVLRGAACRLKGYANRIIYWEFVSITIYLAIALH